MAIFRCKSCGGDLDVKEGVSVVECEYCGNKQTLPKVTDENLQGLFNRANFLRQKCEFDKAEKIYEKILEEDEREAEAYWGIILCKFGIEYVKDPGTENMIPTCHRASYDSIAADEYYKQAIKYADAIQRPVYEADAKRIDEIQKQILDISRKEKPYDVFICYKETDSNGQRTHDSVMANDIYYQLTQEGFKVFYAAITLEGKLGSDYEAIIFAALNSAKVMLAVGSKPEYFQATWVRNEWSRYLQIMKKDRSRLLIPCYSGMDAYDLPEEFAHLQAQDMSKIGFINDLVRGIKKVIVKEEPKEAAAAATVAASSTVAPMLKRAFMFLEDGEFGRADSLCEQVLNQDPENAMAYVGKLMANLKVRKMSSLGTLVAPFDNELNYNKAIRFGDESLKETLKGYNDTIRHRDAMSKKEQIYAEADSLVRSDSATVENYRRAAHLFATIKEYNDAEARSAKCLETANEKMYKEACGLMKSGSSADYLEAIDLFDEIKGYKDADSLAKECEALAVEAEYKEAVEDMSSAETYSDYELAAKAFEELGGYKDSPAKAKECHELAENVATEAAYQEAVAKMEKAASVAAYTELIKAFESLGNYKDSQELKKECEKRRGIHQDIEDKIARSEKAKETRKGCITLVVIIAIIGAIIFGISQCGADKRAIYKEGEALFSAGEWEQAITKLEELDMSYKKVGSLLYEARRNLIKKYFDEGKIEEAEALWVVLDEEHPPVKEEVRLELNYHQAAAYAKAENYTRAYEIYKTIVDYSDVQDKIEQLRKTILGKIEAWSAEKKYQEAYELVKSFEFSEEELPSDVKNILKWLAESDYRNAVRAGLNDIEIPEGVTEISDNMFSGCENLKSIKLPSTLTRIGVRAFDDCVNLTSITIPSGVTEIAAGAFIDCTALTEVTLPSSLVALTDSVFENCTALTSITIPDSVTEIQLDAFRGCTALANVTLPANVATIGDTAFISCHSLTSITLPSGLRSIGSKAFRDCKALTSIVVPNGVEYIGGSVFQECIALTEITIPFVGEKADETGARNMGHIFYEIPASLKNVVVTGGNTIADNAFKNMNAIVSVTLPDSITSIGASAFYGCSSLSSIKMSNQVKTINATAFKDCSSLLSITLPTTLTGIGDKAFENCYKLSEVYNLSKSLTVVKGDDSHGFVAKNAKAVHLSSSAQSVLFKDGDFVFIQDGSDYIMLAYTGVSDTVILPSVVKGSTYKIADFAFYRNPFISTVKISAGVTDVGAYAFYECVALTSVEMVGNGVKTVGDDAFYNCDALTTVKLSSALTSIGTYAFANCKNLKEVAMPSTLSKIDKYAFRDTSLSLATFINNTEGWWYTNNIEAESGTAISPSDLSNSITAANKLCSALTGYYLRRTI